MPWTPIGKFEWPILWSLITGVPAYASRWPTWAEVSGKPATYAPAAHTHAAADITSGTFAPARISQESVTQYQSAMAIDWSQLYNMGELSTWRTTAPASKATLGQDAGFRDVTVGRPDGTGVLFFGSLSRYLYYNGSTYVLQTPAGEREVLHTGNFDPATKLGTTGNWEFTGRIRAISGGKFEAYDLLGDIAVVEIGGGWANGTDGVGYVLNRRPAHPLILAGRNGAVHLDVGTTAGQSTLNSELSSTGGFAGFNFLDRATPSQAWTWYSTGGIARLWFSGSGDLIWVSGDGLRAFNGLNQGQTDAGWNLRWNAIAPGVGASEYINNRQGGSGGHLFATRQNEGQTPQQHHHMLSDGRMNVRSAAGAWAAQPRIFVQSSDPGGHASPGDLWFHPV